MLREIGLGALLHDVGKIAVPDRILLKPDKLTDDEWQEMRKHPEAGYRIVKRIEFLKDAAEIVHAHHERYDGIGYPRGLKGDEIPVGARLFAAVDVYDALTSKRPYRSPMAYVDAVAAIKGQSGNHFDSAVVESFLSLDPKELQAIADRYRDVNQSDSQ
jgi:HD-GYP domain-containing protein (c-di-GMP phosphodiesterase class II)